MNTWIGVSLVASALGSAAAQEPAAAPGATDIGALLEQMKRERIEQDRRYEERIQKLERELRAFQTERAAARDEDELDELLRLAEASGPAPVARPQTSPTILNPQISVIPDFVARWLDVDIDGDADAIEAAFPELFEEQDPFRLRETEIELRAPVAPGADAFAALAVGDEESASFEEVYVELSDLPWDLRAKIGQFKLDFGRMNRVHQHNLPQTDRPIVHSLVFGPEGTASPGISVSKTVASNEPGGLLPAWSELTVEAVNSGNEESPLFAEGPINDAAVNARWKNFWQMNEAQDLEIGVSGLATGNNKSGDGESSTVLGTDVTWRYKDQTPGGYENWLVQAEVLSSTMQMADDDPSGSGTVDAVGGYLTVQRQIDPQWYAGVRFDRAEAPTVEDAEIWGVAPYVTHEVNEFIRLRFQYLFMNGDVGGTSATSHGLSAQLTWVFGAHPPHPYWANQ